MDRIFVKYMNKGFPVNVRKLGFFGKILGLMFKFNFEKCENLLFDFSKQGRRGIHSFFVFSPFLAIWLDDEDRVVDFKVVRPWTFHISAKSKFSKLIEVPLSEKNSDFLAHFGISPRDLVGK